MVYFNVLKNGDTAVPDGTQIEAAALTVAEDGTLSLYEDPKGAPVATFPPGSWDVAYDSSGKDDSAVAVHHESDRAELYGEKVVTVIARGLPTSPHTDAFRASCDVVRRENGALVIERLDKDKDRRVPNLAFAPEAWKSYAHDDDDGVRRIARNPKYRDAESRQPAPRARRAGIER